MNQCCFHARGDRPSDAQGNDIIQGQTSGQLLCSRQKATATGSVKLFVVAATADLAALVGMPPRGGDFTTDKAKTSVLRKPAFFRVSAGPQNFCKSSYYGSARPGKWVTTPLFGVAIRLMLMTQM